MWIAGALYRPMLPPDPSQRCSRLTALAVVLGLAAPLLWPGPAHAKITNVQALAGKPVDEGISGKINVSGNVRAGNVQLVLGSAGTTLGRPK